MGLKAGWDSQNSVLGNLGNLQLRNLEKLSQKNREMWGST